MTDPHLLLALWASRQLPDSVHEYRCSLDWYYVLFLDQRVRLRHILRLISLSVPIRGRTAALKTARRCCVPPPPQLEQKARKSPAFNLWSVGVGNVKNTCVELWVIFQWLDSRAW